MKKIISLVPLESELIAQIQSAAAGFKFVDDHEQQLSAEELAQAEIILGWSSLVAQALQSGQHHIKWIQIWFAGVDKLPLELLQSEQVLLTTASGANAPAIAQQVMGVLLTKARHLDDNSHHQNQARWEVSHHLTEITGKTILTLGTGNIAKSVMQYAKRFQMKVWGANSTGHAVAGFEEVVAMDDVAKLLQGADYVVNTLPLTDLTRDVVNQTFFDQMKSTAYYVNVGRGQTNKEADLLEALNSGRIAGAYLDVFAEEPLPKASPFWKHPKVFVTPHSAGHTDYYNQRIIASFLRNLPAYLAGDDFVENLVDYQKQY